MKDVEKFLCPKPFQGNFLLLQKNDREEWKNFRPKKNSGFPSQVIKDLTRSPAI